jgi:hypothetical protein
MSAPACWTLVVTAVCSNGAMLPLRLTKASAEMLWQELGGQLGHLEIVPDAGATDVEG